MSSGCLKVLTHRERIHKANNLLILKPIGIYVTVYKFTLTANDYLFLCWNVTSENAKSGPQANQNYVGL